MAQLLLGDSCTVTIAHSRTKDLEAVCRGADILVAAVGRPEMITGDMVHHPCQLAHPEWSSPSDSDPVASAVMRRSIFESTAEQPVLVIGTHFAAPTAGLVRRDGDAFRFEGAPSEPPDA